MARSKQIARNCSELKPSPPLLRDLIEATDTIEGDNAWHAAQQDKNNKKRTRSHTISEGDDPPAAASSSSSSLPSSTVQPQKKQRREYEQKQQQQHSLASATLQHVLENNMNSGKSFAGIPPSTVKVLQAMKQREVHSHSACHATIIKRFIRAAIRGEEEMRKLAVTMVDQQGQVKKNENIGGGAIQPFLVALFKAHIDLDKDDRLVPELYAPYRAQLRSFIRLSHELNNEQPEFNITLASGRVTLQTTLLHAIVHHWSINNTHHISYDWLCGALSIPNYPINALFLKHTALAVWSHDEEIRTAIVCHRLIEAGADMSSFALNLDESIHRAASMVLHECAHLVFDRLFESKDDDGHTCWYQARLIEKSGHTAITQLEQVDDDEEDEISSDEDLADSRNEESVVEKAEHEEEKADKEDDDMGAGKEGQEEEKKSEEDGGAARQEEADHLCHVSESAQRHILFLTRYWREEYRLKLHSIILDSTPIVHDCVAMCLQYLDGSGRE